MSRADWVVPASWNESLERRPDETQDADNANRPDPQLSKQVRYRDSEGEDWIDEFARSSTPEEFRGAMRFSIGKYVRRMGKKDERIKEIKKIADYANRWADYEERLTRD